MKDLRDQLKTIANVAHANNREYVLAALMTGAELAFSRVRELGDTYNLTSGVEAAEKELRDDGSRAAMKSPVPLSTVDEQ